MIISSRLFASVCAVVAWAAHAQAPRPDAANASTQKLRYESALADYRPSTESELVSWKQANSEAAALGGHKGQTGMRDSLSPATSKSRAMTGAPDTQTPVPAAGPGGSK